MYLLKTSGLLTIFLAICSLYFTIYYRCASTLVQRGYDNVFLLSGGLRVASLCFPERLVVKGGEGEGGSSSFSEGDVYSLEERMEEVLARGNGGAGRLGSYAPSVRWVCTKISIKI